MGNNRRGRSRGRSSSRRKLPPIPECSLSSQRVGRSAKRNNVTGGARHINKTKRGGTTPPSPESRSPTRRHGSNRTSEYHMVTEAESRDDDEASAVVPTEVVVPSSPEASTAVSSPARHSSKSLINLPVNDTTSPTKNDDATEQWWKEYQRSHSDVAIAADGSANDYPEITSIPTDEILDSSNRKPSQTVSDEDSISRDERDQYQLDRLKARIDQRAERSRDYIDEDDDSPNYKSLRSSRIKNVRSLYSPNTKDQSGDTSTNGSTIPSITHGQTINSSTVSSAEISEYREKIFSKMLHMLNDLSPNSDNIFQDDDTLSHIKDTVIDESRACCGSVEEFQLIQRLTEETMSRILHEFEQNNSLVEYEDPVVDNEGIPEDFAKEHESPQIETKTKVDHEFPPHVFRDIGTMSITSKLSDVTSPTHHDGFEIDEISPVSHCRSMSSLHGSITNDHGQKKLHPSLSPAAAAAAKMAASNGTLQSLPCVMEVPETIDLSNEDSDSGSNCIKKDEQPLGDTNVKAKTHNCHGNPSVVKESSNTLELIVKEAEVLLESEKGTSPDQPGDEEYADTRHVAAQEEHFHDEILSAVLKATTTTKRVEDAAFIAAQPLAEDYDNDTNELMEVTSILSKYEETEGARKAKEKVEAKMSTKIAETSKPDNDDISVLPFDEKKVRFLEDQNQATCGACTIM